MSSSILEEESGCGSSDSNLSPCLSPVFTYSGFGAAQEHFEAYSPIYCFNCKGRPRPGSSDNSFNRDGFILRKELETTLQNLLKNNRDYVENQMDFSDHYGHGGGFFFNQNLDPLDPTDFKLLLIKSRKNIHTLQILSNPSSHLWEDSEDPDGIGKPIILRRNVCQFFNFLTTNVRQGKVHLWKSEEELEHSFHSFKEAFGNVKENWEDYLKTYGGHRDGNECSTPLYNLFHLMLEIRWSLLVIYEMTSDILSWVLNDLIHLAWIMFTRDIKASISSKQPFNCWCVKELWTMIFLLCEKLSKNFWNSLGDSLKSFRECLKQQTPENKFCFPLWLISHLSSLSDYSIDGKYSPGERKKSDASNTINNPYNLVNAIIKEWNTGPVGERTNPCEIYKLLFTLLDYWEYDQDLVFTLWTYWLPKLNTNINLGPNSLEYYSSVDKWSKLIKSLPPHSEMHSPQKRYHTETEIDKFIFQDEFLLFLKLLVGHARYSSGKDWKKLKSHIGMNLNKNNVGGYGEIGMLRLSSLYLALAFTTSDTCALCNRLMELFKYGKSTPSRTKTTLRGTATAIYILLTKLHDISKEDMTNSFMTTVNSLMSQLPLDSAKKDNVMIYLDLLDTLPNTAPFSESSLGRDSLISPNLTMWLSSCGQNYTVRTLRILNKITSWIISSKLNNCISNERDNLSIKIFERAIPFLTQAVILSANRVPSTDVEPMASLAADLTLFSKWRGSNTNGSESVPRLFDQFALNERTCPEVSQFYVAKLVIHQSQLREVNNLKWCQTWVRLCALDLSIPEELHELVLGTEFLSTSNYDMLQRLCVKSEEWSRGDVQNILQPLPALAKAALGGIIFKENAASIVSSIVRTCSQIFELMDFEKLYIRGDSLCVGTQLVTTLCPPFVGSPPWEKFSRNVVSSLKEHLFSIFQVIVSYQGYSQDNFLHRKVNDLLTFAFLGFTDDILNENIENPGIKMLIYSEDNDIKQVFDQSISVLCNTTNNDQKLTQRFVIAVSALKKRQCATTVIRFVPGIIFIYVTAKANSSLPLETLNMCSGILMYSCAFGFTPFKDSILQAFDSIMEANFAFKSKQFFELAFALCKSPKPQAKKFLRVYLLPLYDQHVRQSEIRRNKGTDNSLRGPLEKLEMATAGFDQL